MAKVVKDTRVTMDVDTELEKIKSGKKQKDVTKDKKKDNSKKQDVKKSKSTKKSFFKEVKSELDKVKWPSKKDMVKYSIATIVFIIFFALFFYLIDIIIALLMKAGA